MGKFFFKSEDGTFLCFNHAVLAVGNGIKSEIADVQGYMPAIKCKWCQDGVPDFHHPEPQNLWGVGELQ